MSDNVLYRMYMSQALLADQVSEKPVTSTGAPPTNVHGDNGPVRVQLVWIERDRRGTELAKRASILVGESQKTPTRNYVAKLIARHHPELISVDRVHLVEAYEPGCKWQVRTTELDANRWQTVYATPMEDADELPESYQEAPV
jgi:hypothetical protein